jgi:excinuclease ABC subunit B
MQKTIDETNYRRTKQINYNTQHNKVPQALDKKIDSAFTKNPLVEYELGHTIAKAAEPETAYLSKPELEKLIREKRKAMEKAAKDLDFMQAAKFRDEIKALQEKLS